MPGSDNGKTWPDVVGTIPARLVAISFFILIGVFSVFSGTAIYAWFTGQTLVLAGYEFGVSSIRPDAVVAYDRDECPSGWKPFDEATARFLVGAGDNFRTANEKDESGNSLTPKSYRMIGGAEQVALTIEQIPEHRHGIPLVTGNTVFSDAGQGTNVPYFDYRTRQDVALSIAIQKSSEGVAPTGGSQPHANLPPFIALKFCKRAR